MSRQVKKKRPLINLSEVLCPKCVAKQLVLRRPRNSREVFKGGWTCKRCGCEMDRYGNEIKSSSTLKVN